MVNPKETHALLVAAASKRLPHSMVQVSPHLLDATILHLAVLAGMRDLATKWLFDDGFLTGDPKVDEPTMHRASAKRECAHELLAWLDQQ